MNKRIVKTFLAGGFLMLSVIVVSCNKFEDKAESDTETETETETGDDIQDEITDDNTGTDEPSLLKLCYLCDTEDLQDWDEGLFIEDGKWSLLKEHSEEGGHLLASGSMDDTDTGLIAYFDEFARPLEIYADGYIYRLYDYTQDSAETVVIKDGKIVEKFTIDISGIQAIPSIQTKNEVLTSSMNIISSMFSMAGYLDLLSKGTRLAVVASSIGYHYSAVSFALEAVSLATGIDIGPDFYTGNLLQLGGLSLDLATSIYFGVGTGALAVAGAVASVIAVYSNLWDTYWDLYNNAIEDIYGACQASISNVQVDTDQAEITVNITGYEAFGIGYLCGAAVEQSVFNPSVNESTQKTEVTSDGDYRFIYTGLELGKSYKARPFLENTDGISLWKSFIGNWAGPLIRYGQSVQFTTTTPSAITGDVRDITMETAVVTCSFSGTSSKTKCRINLTSEHDLQEYDVSNSDGESELSLTGLTPGTEYTYYASVEYNGITVYGRRKTFTTALPDIVDLWNCIEYKSDGTYDSYRIALYEDGTVWYWDSADSPNVGSSWTLTADGKVSISVVMYSSATQSIGKDWTLTLDDIYDPNPIRMSGTAHQWNFNQVGYRPGEYKRVEMHR